MLPAWHASPCFLSLLIPFSLPSPLEEPLAAQRRAQQVRATADSIGRYCVYTLVPSDVLGVARRMRVHFNVAFSSA